MKVMRFTIRDLLWIIVVVGMGLGWWVDHRTLDLANRHHRGKLFKAGLRLIPLESFTQGEERISSIHDAAKSSPPPPEAAAEIIHHVRYDPDWRIRVRAMAVLPFLSERAEATKVLLDGFIRDADETPMELCRFMQ